MYFPLKFCLKLVSVMKQFALSTTQTELETGFWILLSQCDVNIFIEDYGRLK